MAGDLLNGSLNGDILEAGHLKETLWDKKKIACVPKEI